MDMDKELVSLLFETHAFKVAPENEPFWYTSGKLGSYFINVDYLYGSKEDSAELLSFIDDLLASTPKEDIPYELCEKIMDHYDNNEMFKTVIDKLVEYIETNFQTNLIDYISGGERRDWFFSVPVANLLGKPHITIFKDLTTVASTSDFEESTTIDSVAGKRIFHIADILNTGSSFQKAWVPAINKLGSKINWAMFVVDRNQHGEDHLKDLGIQTYSLMQISRGLFDIAVGQDIISIPQYDMLCEYFEDPDGTMRKFINSHPTFIEDAINNSSDPKAAQRAKICKEKNYYGNPLGDWL